MRVNKKILNKETKESFSPLDEKKERYYLFNITICNTITIYNIILFILIYCFVPLANCVHRNIYVYQKYHSFSKKYHSNMEYKDNGVQKFK